MDSYFAAKARVAPLGAPAVMNMLAPLVRRMFANRENEFMLLQIGFCFGGRDRAPWGARKDKTRLGMISSNWVEYIVCNTL